MQDPLFPLAVLRWAEFKDNSGIRTSALICGSEKVAEGVKQQCRFGIGPVGTARKAVDGCFCPLSARCARWRKLIYHPKSSIASLLSRAVQIAVLVKNDSRKRGLAVGAPETIDGVFLPEFTLG